MDGAAVLLMGPTGVGKSDLALALADRLPLEIVSVDSALVYRGLDVGTAKPDRALRERIAHHLIDIRDPAESYSVGEFVRDAGAAMAAIRARGRVPLLVGGTMLYFRALQAGLARLPPRDAAFRAALAERAERLGWPALHLELERIDPRAAARIEPADAQRIERALEVHALTGLPLSYLQREDLRGAERTEVLKLVVAPRDRAWLNERLAARLRVMMERGLLAEVERLNAQALPPEAAVLRAVGYRQFLEHLAGRLTLAEARERALIATRQLAKRQLTWLRAERGSEWYPAEDSTTGESLCARASQWLAARGEGPGGVC
jgi:tRNA dimethylallyltransferase